MREVGAADNGIVSSLGAATDSRSKHRWTKWIITGAIVIIIVLAAIFAFKGRESGEADRNIDDNQPNMQLSQRVIECLGMGRLSDVCIVLFRDEGIPEACNGMRDNLRDNLRDRCFSEAAILQGRADWCAFIAESGLRGRCEIQAAQLYGNILQELPQ